MSAGIECSEKIDLLAKALTSAQAEFETVAKDATNPFFKSKYADLPAVTKAAAPVLAKYELAVVQLPGCDEAGDTLTTMVLHASGQYLAGSMRLRPVKNDPQAQGSALTYARRYAYMAALGLVADEDDDGNAASAQRKRAEVPAATLPAQTVTSLFNAVTTLGYDKDPGKQVLKTKLTALGIQLAGGLKATLGTLTEAQAKELEAWTLAEFERQEAADA